MRPLIKEKDRHALIRVGLFITRILGLGTLLSFDKIAFAIKYNITVTIVTSVIYKFHTY